MNSVHIVRYEASAEGVTLRLWVDDPEGRHVTVAEMHVNEDQWLNWARSVMIQQDHRDQQEFEYGD